MATCSVSVCDHKATTHGLCGGHYQRQVRGLPLDTPLRPKKRREYVTRACEVCGTPFEFYTAKNAAGRFCSRVCFDSLKGEQHPNWRGGRGITKEGYVEVYDPATRRRVQEHRQVMEDHLGRKLSADETVHHRNGVKHDNRIANLQLWTSRHPRGQAIEDLVAFAREILDLYGGIADLE